MTVIEQARAMYAESRTLHADAQRLRRRAVARRRELETFCREHNIELVLVTKSEGGHGHGDAEDEAAT